MSETTEESVYVYLLTSSNSVLKWLGPTTLNPYDDIYVPH